MIEVKDIHKTFGDNEVLKGISSKFLPGKNNLIIGGSGSGKTTLLKCIVGLHEPTKGDVFFDEENFTEMNFEQRVPIRTQIGMLFQNSALFDSMTVEENIMFPLNLFTTQSKAEKVDRANFCLERVNLKGKNKLYPSELSGGQKNRRSDVDDQAQERQDIGMDPGERQPAHNQPDDFVASPADSVRVAHLLLGSRLVNRDQLHDFHFPNAARNLDLYRIPYKLAQQAAADRRGGGNHTLLGVHVFARHQLITDLLVFVEVQYNHRRAQPHAIVRDFGHIDHR